MYTSSYAIVSLVRYKWLLSSFRSYLIQRPLGKSDPDPRVSTVLLHIWPLMLLVTLAKLSMLTCTAGLIGPYIFIAIAVLFLINLAALLTFCKETVSSAKVYSNNTADPEDSQPLQNKHGEEEEEEESFFVTAATAALCATWLSSVVGDQSRKIFLVSGMTSLISKVLLLAIVVGLSASGLQPHIYRRPFLLFCFEENSPLLTEDGITPCRFSEGDCFPDDNMTLMNEVRYNEALAKLYNNVLAFQNVVVEIGKDIQSSDPKERDILQNQLYNASAFLDEVKQTKVKLDEKATSSKAGHVQQRVRICEENEIIFQLCLLLGLISVIILAAYSIHRLHKIADYEVRFNTFVFMFQKKGTKKYI